MTEPRVEDVYRPSFRKCILRTMGACFISGYLVGSSFRLAAGSRCDYGQYLANKLCAAGVCFQLGRRLTAEVVGGVKKNFISWRLSPWK
ncbi:uncharacterized protein Eint_060505 [Encephalitozoon intestinalis ATCC 50506]|uniref:Uncharacterized protein n=1 Tax=Encephalitozoon intestinalis (strain ATCC 50506) TaxID=876142 RepID=W8PGR1_ENCIT|nr:uncharacterized protein Eint_060505 [Encephalitozoon intestinalis ATCC 50506]AHL30116.1 hypothetical protein Eint_060505 [Encephalitozoon intestinalis ATCC 50506]UTX45394.1 hypothetical protein GPK93_06g09460 [Encephalitozoon intestinalis]